MGFFFGRNPTTKGLRDSGHVMFDHPDIGAFGGACLAHGIRKEHSTQFDFESARGGPLVARRNDKAARRLVAGADRPTE